MKPAKRRRPRPLASLWQARLVLQHTVDDEDVELVMSGIKQSMQEAEGTTDVTMAEIMFCPRPLARKGVWLALMLAFFQQATGSELLVNYVPEMMEDAGVTTITMQVRVCLCMRDVKEVHTGAHFVCRQLPFGLPVLIKRGVWTYESGVSSPSIRRISSMCGWWCWAS